MNDTTTEIAQRNPAQELVQRVRGDGFKQQIALALPEGVKPERFVRATVTALMQNPEIALAEADSVFASLLRAAQDGLMPDGREAALVLFNVKVKDAQGERWEKRAQYLPMIGGYRKIAAEHGWAIRTHVVYQNDEFNYELGEQPTLLHKPPRLDVERGEAIGAYAVATHRDGRKQLEVLTGAEIEKVRGVSRSKDRGPWVDWTDRMWEKTAGRRLFAKLPLDESDARVARVITADIEPEQAAAMLYGPHGAHAFEAREIEAPPVAAPADAPHEPMAGGGQQDEPAETTTAPLPPAGSGAGGAAGSSPGSDVDYSDEPEETETAAVQQELAAEQPGIYPWTTVRVTGGKYGPLNGVRELGMTVAEIAATDQAYVREYLASKVKDEEVKRAAQAWCRAYPQAA